MELSRGARRQGARMYEARFKQIDDFRGGAADTGGQFRLVDAIISKSLSSAKIVVGRVSALK
jgi:hypothetical protein